MKLAHASRTWSFLAAPLFLLCFGVPSAAAQGSIIGWGHDDYGQATGGPPGAAFTQLAGGYHHSIALRSNGSLVSWGIDNNGLVSNTPSGTDFVRIAGGFAHSLALRSNGSIEAWGWDGLGQVSTTPTSSDFQEIDTSLYFSLALRHDGSIAAWGSDFSGSVSKVPLDAGYTQVSAGGSHAHALRADGSIAAWGTDSGNYDFGQVNDTPQSPGWIQVAAGGRFSVALHSSGALRSWGYDGWGSVSNTPTGTGFVQVAASAYHSMAMRADGSIVTWGVEVKLEEIGSGQVTDAPGEAGFSLMGMGYQHSLALFTENVGSPYCFGDGSLAACPCGANGNSGEGCANTGGVGGAQLAASGHAFVVGDDFQLDVTGVSGARPGLILRGNFMANGGMGNPVGDGLLCVSGQTARSQIQVTVAGGTTFTDFQGQPFGQSSFGGGVLTNYQFWYRDPGNTCSGAGFNFSNAWTVAWLP